jgi:hypothetical protein
VSSVKEPTLLLSHLPPFLTNAFADLAQWLHQKSAARLPLILTGILFAHGRRTVSSWFRAADITDDFRPAYTTVWAVGRKLDSLAVSTLYALRPLLGKRRLRLAIDDTPTTRYGPHVEGAGIHHNPTPGPAGETFLYGHVWVTLAVLASHPHWGTIALPLQAQLYIRRCDLDKLPPERPREFRTKLEMAAEQLHWLTLWTAEDFEETWVVVDGAYAKRPFLRAARLLDITVVSRLRKDAALWSLPKRLAPEERGRGRPPIYGKERFSLAKRAGHSCGWEQVECVQYGQKVTKTIKTFLATWKPAGGVIRVVIVKEADGWLAYFSVGGEATTVEILEAMADRNAEEQTFKDIKEVEGAGQQQVRNVESSAGCFNLNLWMYSLVEAWAWNKTDADLVNRSASPWDDQPRRPSHADKRKSLQHEVLEGEIREALSGRPSKAKIRALADRLLDLAA